MPQLSRRDMLKAAAAAGIAVAVGAGGVGGDARAQNMSVPGALRLWYRKPARKWVEALPVGNGRLGAMVFGGVERDQIQFNEDTVWTGEPHEYQHEGAVKFLPEIRRLLAEGKQKEAEDLAMREFMSVPLRQKAYQPFGDLRIEFPGHRAETGEFYQRTLDLDSAIAWVGYSHKGVQYRRAVFASFPDQVIVTRLTTDESGPGKLNFIAKLDGAHELAKTRQVNNQLALSGGVAEGAIKFEARLQVIAEGGKVEVSENQISVRDADAATLLLTGATNHVNYRDVSANPAGRCERVLTAAASQTYDKILERHVEDHRKLFMRCSLDLGKSEGEALPTDERLVRLAKTGKPDPELEALYFQYGRYLLIASSRAGTQPANL